jgi:uncharacterized protein (TIGR03118 family)
MDRRKAQVWVLVAGAVSALLISAIATAQSPSPGPPNRQNVGFIETDLVTNKPSLTDSNGIVHTPKPCGAIVPQCVDPNLVNPWGLVGSTPVASPPSNTPSPWWISDNGSNQATLYNDDTVLQTFTINSRVVLIPCPGSPTTACGTPTGIVWNIAPASTPPAFPVSGFTSTSVPMTAASSFIFATEDGTIVGWNSLVNPSGVTTGNDGIIKVDNSSNPVAGSGAVYKGLAIATDSNGTTLLYVTNFRYGTVEMYDKTWAPVVSPSAFMDPNLPSGYAPFNIVLVGNRLIVTYAVQRRSSDPAEDKKDDVAGPGHGVVNSFDLSGHGLKRLVSPGRTSLLNSPWGVALAPQNFGALAGALLIGNFGDGHINGYDQTTGKFIGTMHYAQSTKGLQGKPVTIDGLWALKVGNDKNGKGGYANALYFTAGPNGEADGLFGALTPDGLYGTPPYPFPGP